MRSSVIGAHRKLLWIWHELWADGRLRATEEILGVHVAGGLVAPFPDDVVARALAACVAPPAEAGRRIGPLPATPVTNPPASRVTRRRNPRISGYSDVK